MREGCVIVIGPTASGKTSFAHATFDFLASKGISSELVNLDAFQFYREVTAGTAKPTKEECAQYRYHGIDFLETRASFDAQNYAKFARNVVSEICAKGSIPICVGGSGLYLRAFLHGLDSFPSASPIVRKVLRAVSEKIGWNELHGILAKIDPVRAQELHPNDGVRIERALEICMLSGKLQSEVRTRTATLADQKTHFSNFVVQVDAPDIVLRERIFARIPLMFERGWLQEVVDLKEKYGEELTQFNAIRAIGYLDIIQYLQQVKIAESSEKLFEQLLQQIGTRTWQYARRQRVWNAKEKCDAKYVFGSSMQPQFESILSFCSEL